MTRRWVVLAGLALLEVAVVLADVYLTPGMLFPAPPYALPIVAAIFLLPPRMVGGLAVWALALQAIAYWLDLPRPSLPPWLPFTYLIGTATFGALSTLLSANTQAIRSSERHYRLLFETMLQGVIYQAGDGKITSMNPAASHILGRSPADLLGQSSVSVHHETVREDGTPFPGLELPAMIAQRTGREVSDVVMGVWNARQRQYRWINVSAVPVFRRGEQRPHEVYTLFEDITERRRAAEERSRLFAEVHRRAAELDAIFTAIPDGVVIYDGAGAVTRLNPAAGALIGLTPEELQRPLAERVAIHDIETPDGKPFPIDSLPHVRALRGETVSGEIMVFQRPRASGTVWVLVSAAPIRTPDGGLIGAVSASTDISQLHGLQEWRQDMLRAASHDLRNPLAAITGWAQLIQARLQEQGQEQDARGVKAILENARRMNDMIQELLESARLESGRLEMKKAPTDLRQLVDNMVARLSTTEEGARIQVLASPSLPPVAVDPQYLERAIGNITGNALKYSPPDAPVIVRIEPEDGQVAISVTDRGPGIAPEDLPHLFQRFYRTKAAEKVQGTGLGLYITRLIVEAHGGRIWVDSEVGQGSTFHVRLPVA